LIKLILPIPSRLGCRGVAKQLAFDGFWNFKDAHVWQLIVPEFINPGHLKLDSFKVASAFPAKVDGKGFDVGFPAADRLVVRATEGKPIAIGK